MHVIIYVKFTKIADNIKSLLAVLNEYDYKKYNHTNAIASVNHTTESTSP
jgi:hypothetical protein